MNKQVLHVYMVVEYAEDGSCRVDKLYTDLLSAQIRVNRLESNVSIEDNTFHILKKSVVGTRAFGRRFFTVLDIDSLGEK